MSLDGVNLNRGFFHFTTPYNWVGWIFWIIGLLMVVAGLVSFMVGGRLVCAFRFFILSALTPSSFHTVLLSVTNYAPHTVYLVY
mgnify:CR=1 FL=1